MLKKSRKRRLKLLPLDLENRRLMTVGNDQLNDAAPNWFEQIAGTPPVPDCNFVGPLAVTVGNGGGDWGPLAVTVGNGGGDWKASEEIAQWIVRLAPEATQQVGFVTVVAAVLNSDTMAFQVVRGLGIPAQVLVCANESNEAVCGALSGNSNVASFEPDAYFFVQVMPNGPDDPLLTGLNNVIQFGGTADADIDAPDVPIPAFDDTQVKPFSPGDIAQFLANLQIGVAKEFVKVDETRINSMVVNVCPNQELPIRSLQGHETIGDNRGSRDPNVEIPFGNLHPVGGTIALTLLDESQLKAVIYARLQGCPSEGPFVDSRIGPEPFEWLSEQFRRGDAGLQHRMTAVLGDFLDELTDTAKWPERTRFALLDLIQDCGDGLVDRLFQLVRQQTFLKAAELGPDVHAGLLKCLISNGHHATPEFWLKQAEVLGSQFGALILSGLIDHGLDFAMSQLPRLCAQEPARTYARWLFPTLQDKFGTAAVWASLQRLRTQLPADALELYESDLLSAISAVDQFLSV